MVVLDHNGWEYSLKEKIEAVPVYKNVGNGLDLHVRNFLDSIKNDTPQKYNPDIDIGRNLALVAQMGGNCLQDKGESHLEKRQEALYNQYGKCTDHS